MSNILLPDGIIGTTLNRVEELLWLDDTDESARPMREAMGLVCGEYSVLTRALGDTSELVVTLGSLECTESEHTIVDASENPRYQRFIGKTIRNWWQATNKQGYADCFLIALEANSGLCFVAINNEVSVLTVEGEQLS